MSINGSKNVMKYLKMERIMSSIKKKIYLWSRDIIVIIILIFMAWLLFQSKNKYDKSELLYITKSLTVEEGEQRSRYNQMMIRILTVYGYTYDKRYKKAMSKEEKIKYIRFNYKCATALQLGLFDLPIIDLMESNFNPYMIHQYGEMGLGGIKFNTALLAHEVLSLMPANLRRLLKFEIKSKNDLLDPFINMKVTYIMLWHERRQFKNREDWYISAYHWGAGHIGRRWDNGKGELPVKFTLGGIEYNVVKYYATFKEFKTAFEMGDLEAGIPIKEKWEAYVKKMEKEEIDFRKTKSIIRNLRKKVKSVKYEKDEYIKGNKELEELLWKSNKDLKKIAGEVRQGGGIKKLSEGTKRIVKNLLKKIKYKEQSGAIQILIIAGCCLIILFMIFMFVFGLIKFFGRTKKK